MKIILDIRSCRDCKHLDHTGAFTKGGAKPCCNHPVTCEEKGYDCFKRVIPYRTNYEELGGIERPIRTVKGIPIWCPLKNGRTY
jgi:hypothetical protein